jgi:NTP pyrophosphatase (non-canonical NTP hydrolase)|nr:MAG TPA: nucleoside triphosphate pyrophosphohydrolase [Caudoviricetes sp.]
MTTNETERDKALQEVIDFCTNWANAIYDDKEGDYYADFMQIDALTRVIRKCRSMLGSGSMPSDVPNQSEDANVRGGKPIDNDQEHAVWRESIEKYGKETQSIVCMEECSELIQAVSKLLRGKTDATDNLAEEMADVIICLHLLKEMYDITDEQLNEWIARKTARQSKRMQADDLEKAAKDAK